MKSEYMCACVCEREAVTMVERQKEEKRQPRSETQAVGAEQVRAKAASVCDFIIIFK
jgi:hypothetical protein